MASSAWPEGVAMGDDILHLDHSAGQQLQRLAWWVGW